MTQREFTWKIKIYPEMDENEDTLSPHLVDTKKSANAQLEPWLCLPALERGPRSSDLWECLRLEKQSNVGTKEKKADKHHSRNKLEDKK